MAVVVNDMLLMARMNRQNTPKVPGPVQQASPAPIRGFPKLPKQIPRASKNSFRKGSPLKQTWSTPSKVRPSRMLPKCALGNFLKMTYRPSTSNRTNYATSDASDPGLMTPLRGGKWTVDGRPFRVRMIKAALSISAQKTIEPI
jgi:hypothetical protein